MCDREVLRGSDVRVSVLLPDQTAALSIDLGRIRWVQGNQFGVEFVLLPLEARQRLNRTLRIELIELYKIRLVGSELPESLNLTS